MGNSAKAKMATTVAAEEVPKPVVTNPEIAQQIRALLVLYSLVVIALFAYVAYSNFRDYGLPLWDAFALTAMVAPFFIIPLCFVPWLRDILITAYATEGPSDSTGRDDLSSNLLEPKNV